VLRSNAGDPSVVLPLSAVLVLATAALLATARARTHWQNRALSFTCLALPATLFLAHGSGVDDGANALVCFAYGAAFALPVLAVLVVLERRDRLPQWDAALLGALLGVLAAIILDLECRSRHLPHLALGHASVGWAFIALLTVWAGFRASR
jgi:hypothetical protein